MKKQLIFDMDGTIADLFHVNEWLQKLRNEDTSPYTEAEPMYNMNELTALLNTLKANYTITIVSWSSKGGTNEYNRRVKKAKKEWLDRYNFPYDKIHVVKYGTLKQNFIETDFAILVDDNEAVRTKFLKSKRGNIKMVINAKHDIMSQLMELI